MYHHSGSGHHGGMNRGHSCHHGMREQRHHGGGSCNCGCGHNEHHFGQHHHGSDLGPGPGFRRFISREEVITNLEEYLKQLKAELAGVEERISELKKGV